MTDAVTERAPSLGEVRRTRRVPNEEQLDIAPPIPDEVCELDASLDPVDLGPFLDGSYSQPVPDMLLRDDGRGLLYDGAINGIHGQSGDGKGWVETFIIRENARRGRRTLLLDFEDAPASIVSRLMLAGMSGHEILTWLVYVRPQVALGPGAVAKFCQLIDERNIAAVFIDSLGEAFALEAIDENKDVEVGPWYRRVARPLADTGAAVLIVDHGTKAADNALHPSGSKRKRAAITGASYLAEAIKPFVKGSGGRLRLTCAKDRHGQYRRGEKVADLVMVSYVESLELTLYAPSGDVGEATAPTILAARAAVTAAKNAGRSVSRNELEGLMAIKAGAAIKRGGIDHAVAEGALTEESGARNARIVTYVGDLDA